MCHGLRILKIESKWAKPGSKRVFSPRVTQPEDVLQHLINQLHWTMANYADLMPISHGFWAMCSSTFFKMCRQLASVLWWPLPRFSRSKIFRNWNASIWRCSVTVQLAKARMAILLGSIVRNQAPDACLHCQVLQLTAWFSCLTHKGNGKGSPWQFLSSRVRL